MKASLASRLSSSGSALQLVIILAQRSSGMKCPANGCKWSEESSPLVNCAKIGLSHFVSSINRPPPHEVCMINSFFPSKASWCSCERHWANRDRTRRRHKANSKGWLVGAGKEDNPCPFIDDPRQAALSYWSPLAARRDAFITTTHHSPERAARWCMAAASPCTAMSAAQSSPSGDAKLLQKQEQTETEGDELQPKDMTTEKGYRSQRSCLPFSVESLISKKPTCRTSYPPSDLALVLPKPGVTQGAPFSPRTLYADGKVSAESSRAVSSSSAEDSPQFCEKEQSTWFQTSSFTTPPRKSVLPLFPDICEIQNMDKMYLLITLVFVLFKHLL